MKEFDIRPQGLFNRYLELAQQDLDQFLSDHASFVQIPCPACTSERYEPGMEKLGFSYVTCLDCRSLYASPRPPTEMIDSYYTKSASAEFWGTHFFKDTAEARREKMFRPRAELVRDWAAREGIGPSETIADVGSGYGIFLEEIARLDLFETVMGIEPGPTLAAICREKGFDILEKTAESVKPGEIGAAFATSFELLEHVYDAAEFLSGVHRLLKPGGIFIFTTLTISGFDLQVLWDKSKSIYPPGHINLLSVSGIEQLVRRTGFEVVELSTPGQLDVDIIRNIVTETPDIPLERFTRQLVFEVSDEARDNYQTFLQTNRLSSHIRVVARAI